MSSIFSSSLDGISSHTSAFPAQPQFQGFESGYGRSPYSRTFLQKHNNTYDDAQGTTNAFPDRQAVSSTSPIYLRQWLATTSDDEESDGPPTTAEQEFMDTHNGYRLPTHKRSPEEPACSPEGFDATPPLENAINPDQLEAELASFASQYLNLDYGTLETGDNTTEGEADSLAISSDTTTFAGAFGGVGTPWEIGSTSVSLLDTTKFEFGMDANGSVTKDLWPLGSHVYQTPGPPVYFNPEEHLRELQVRKWEKKLRRRLVKIFAKEAVLTGKRVRSKKRKAKGGERRKAKGKGKEIEDVNLPQIVAFSEVIRGRTIYNP